MCLAVVLVRAPILFFLGGGKEGNASCTVVPLGTVCGTLVQLASGSILPLDKSAT
jgi:hypothetical protein